MKKYNILTAEDHPLTRQTLVYQLKKQPWVNEVISAENGKQAVEAMDNNKIDVVLMDIDMPIMNGIEATVEIKKKHRDSTIIMLTGHKDRENVLESFSSGANGYCVKDIKVDEIFNIINIVEDGGIWVDKKIAGFIFDVLKHIDEAHKQQKVSIDDFNITERERETLKLVADGLSNDEIAEKLFISRNTVKNHIASLISKLAVKDRVQVAVFALKNNLVD